jgi:hypothetical protein
MVTTYLLVSKMVFMGYFGVNLALKREGDDETRLKAVGVLKLAMNNVYNPAVRSSPDNYTHCINLISTDGMTACRNAVTWYVFHDNNYNLLQSLNRIKCPFYKDCQLNTTFCTLLLSCVAQTSSDSK